MNINSSLAQRRYEALRRWPRYKLDLPIRLVTQRPSKIAIVHGRGRELNNGGMAVFAGIELSIDEQVAVEFTLPCSRHSIRVRGFVRNRSGYTYEIEFISENDADYSNVGQLESILKRLGLGGLNLGIVSAFVRRPGDTDGRFHSVRLLPPISACSP